MTIWYEPNDLMLTPCQSADIESLEPLVSRVVDDMARANAPLEMRMLNPLLALSFQAARFGLEMQSIVALRLMRLMGGGASARSKARRSVSEKMAMVAETPTAVSINNGNDRKVGKTVSSVYKRRGHANKRRLSK